MAADNNQSLTPLGFVLCEGCTQDRFHTFHELGRFEHLGIPAGGEDPLLDLVKT